MNTWSGQWVWSGTDLWVWSGSGQWVWSGTDLWVWSGTGQWVWSGTDQWVWSGSGQGLVRTGQWLVRGQRCDHWPRSELSAELMSR